MAPTVAMADSDDRRAKPKNPNTQPTITKGIMSDQQQKLENMTLFEKAKIIQALALFPAITVMVFIRHKLGFRMMKPIWLVIMTTIILVMSAVAGGVAKPFASLFVIYALTMLGLGLYQRYLRWGDLAKGERWHTYSPGVSYLEMLPIPPFFLIKRRVYRFLDPLACALIGLLLALLSHALGAWVLFSSLALYIYEQALYERMLEQDLDILDGLVAAEVQSEVAQHYEGPQSDEKQMQLEQTAGIPTGVAPDIHRQVELRKAKRAAAPDNIVPMAASRA